MFPFRKKNDEKETVSEENKKTRKPRRKKELARPWGKLERIIVFIIFISVPAFSILFYVHSKNPTPKILSMMVDAPKDVNDLQNSLKGQITNLSYYGIWVESLDGKYKVGINENQKFQGASLFKLPLMIGYFEEVDKGNINPNTNYTLKYSDQAAGAGILATLPPGTIITYHDMVEAMGKSSDNSAFQIITNILGVKKELSVISELGMNNTDFSNSLTTAYDVGLLFSKLINTRILSSSSRQELLDSLKNTDFEILISGGVPSGVIVAHKYGGIGNELNDAGIVYARNPYIIVILSNDPDLNEAQTQIQKISKIVYDWLN